MSEGSDFSLYDKGIFLYLFKGTVTFEDINDLAQPLPEICSDSNQGTSTLQDGQVLPTCSSQTWPSPTADAPTVPLLLCASQHSLTGLQAGLPSQVGIMATTLICLELLRGLSLNQDQTFGVGLVVMPVCLLPYTWGNYVLKEICLGLLVTLYPILGEDLSRKQ